MGKIEDQNVYLFDFPLRSPFFRPSHRRLAIMLLQLLQEIRLSPLTCVSMVAARILVRLRVFLPQLHSRSDPQHDQFCNTYRAAFNRSSRFDGVSGKSVSSSLLRPRVIVAAVDTIFRGKPKIVAEPRASRLSIINSRARNVFVSYD